MFPSRYTLTNDRKANFACSCNDESNVNKCATKTERSSVVINDGTVGARPKQSGGLFQIYKSMKCANKTEKQNHSVMVLGNTNSDIQFYTVDSKESISKLSNDACNNYGKKKKNNCEDGAAVDDIMAQYTEKIKCEAACERLDFGTECKDCPSESKLPPWLMEGSRSDGTNNKCWQHEQSRGVHHKPEWPGGRDCSYSLKPKPVVCNPPRKSSYKPSDKCLEKDACQKLSSLCSTAAACSNDNCVEENRQARFKSIVGHLENTTFVIVNSNEDLVARKYDNPTPIDLEPLKKREDSQKKTLSPKCCDCANTEYVSLKNLRCKKNLNHIREKAAAYAPKQKICSDRSLSRLRGGYDRTSALLTQCQQNLCAARQSWECESFSEKCDQGEMDSRSLSTDSCQDSSACLHDKYVSCDHLLREREYDKSKGCSNKPVNLKTAANSFNIDVYYRIMNICSKILQNVRQLKCQEELDSTFSYDEFCQQLDALIYEHNRTKNRSANCSYRNESSEARLCSQLKEHAADVLDCINDMMELEEIKASLKSVQTTKNRNSQTLPIIMACNQINAKIRSSPTMRCFADNDSCSNRSLNAKMTSNANCCSQRQTDKLCSKRQVPVCESAVIPCLKKKPECKPRLLSCPEPANKMCCVKIYPQPCSCEKSSMAYPQANKRCQPCCKDFMKQKPPSKPCPIIHGMSEPLPCCPKNLVFGPTKFTEPKQYESSCCGAI